MPLIILTGLPCSGKTTIAKKLQYELDRFIIAAKDHNEPGLNLKVIYHSDDTLGISRETYEQSSSEKNARGNQISAVKRDISSKNIVILDTLAYIKGFRYQLFCEAKALQTPHCVLHVLTSLEKCLEWNQSSKKWDPEVMMQLKLRYEEPNGNTRWDSPLYMSLPEDAQDCLPYRDIWESLVLKKTAPPNAATVVKATSDNNFLQELDKQTQDVINKILIQSETNSVGTISIEKGLKLDLPATRVGVPQLQRIRRNFIALNRMRNLPTDRIKIIFTDFVNTNLNSEE